jgi:hypothetical protein
MTGDGEPRRNTGMTGNVEMRGISGNVAGVGAGATGNISIGGTSDPAIAEVQRRLAELQALVERHAADLDDAEAARAAVAEADREVRSGHPQQGRLRMLLSAVAGAAPGVSAVTAAVSGIRGLLGGLG